MAWFSLKDSVTTVQRGQAIPTPSGMAVVPAGPLVRLGSVTQATFDPGGTANIIPGASINGIAIAIGSAKGKLDIECSNSFELAAACAAVGGVGSAIIVAINFVRPGMVPIGYLFMPAVWANGGGFSGDDANGFKDKLSVVFTDAIRNGTSVYNKLA